MSAETLGMYLLSDLTRIMNAIFKVSKIHALEGNKMSGIITIEPEIEIYKDRFKDHDDKLRRAVVSGKFSSLIRNINSPSIIALDGEWGSGKSFFLKCWPGEHLESRREEDKDQIIYFDAFKHDYLDDPLVSLTGAIIDRIWTEKDDKQTKNKKLRKKLQKIAMIAGKSVARGILCLSTSGLSEILASSEISTDIKSISGKILDEVKQEAEKLIDGNQNSKEVDKFWNMHYAKISAMEKFRTTLKKITGPENSNPVKLIIIIDELDRCRPDYALSVLEIIKHFFNIKGIHFILGVNLSGLENSVRARYGDRIDASAYLQKFYSYKVRLPDQTDGTPNCIHYFDHLLKTADNLIQEKMEEYHDDTKEYLRKYIFESSMTLRMVEKIFTSLILAPYSEINSSNHGNAIDINRRTIIALIIINICAPEIYEKMRRNEAGMDDLQKVFTFDQNRDEENIKHWKETVFISDYSLSHVCKIIETHSISI